MFAKEVEEVNQYPAIINKANNTHIQASANIDNVEIVNFDFI